MAAAAATTAAHPAPPTLAGRSTSSNLIDYAAFPSYSPTPATSSSTGKKNKLRLITSSSSSKIPKAGFSSDVSSAAPSPASSTSQFPPPRSDSRPGGKMSSDGGYRIPATHSASLREGPGRAKLHKRGSSGSSLQQQQGAAFSPSSTIAQQTASTSAYGHDEAYTPTSSTTPTGSMPKIRPYLRKMSTKEDTEQGRLDLSKSISENHALSGLGIQDLSLLGSTGAPRSASDVSFAHTKRGHSHARTTSGESAVSTSSRPGAAGKTFVHPMRQTPRPYTPPHGHSFDYSSPPSFASSHHQLQQDSIMNDEERNESSDVLTDDDTAFRLSGGFRGRRSVSISSTPVVVAPTPLSQSHTAWDLGIVPKLTSAANTSQTNLSLKSTRSTKSSSGKPKPTRSRRNTERSFDNTTTASASARTSFDRAFSSLTASASGGGRKSDSDPRTRDQRIEDARRKFEEREERKERKAEGRLMKRRATEEAKGRRSEGRERKKSLPASFPPATAGGGGEVGRGGADPPAAVPEGGRATGSNEEKRSAKTATRKVDETKPPNKFSVWLKMTLLSCGGKG